MTPDRYQRLQSIFETARDLAPPQREAVLGSCDADAELIRHARRLLHMHDQTALALDRPLVDAEARSTLVKELQAPPVPERISCYTVVRRIGVGGNSVVYLAQQSHPIKRSVAIKVLTVGIGGAQQLRRFEYEQQALADVAHPNIVAVIEAGRLEDGTDRPYIVMEYVDGVCMTDYCAARALDMPARLQLLAQVCSAVHHAHLRGVIHRDLKPSNILIADVAGKPLAKVIDFGIAKTLAEAAEPGSVTLTRSGDLLGTLGYMSPEQLGGTCDARSDVFALGVILYELCAGARPIDLRGLTLIEAARRIETATIRSISRSIGRSVGELDLIAEVALSRNRETRYQSVAELAADIQRYLRGEIVAARRPTHGALLRSLVRRHRYLIASLVIGVVLLAAFAGWAVVEGARARRAEAAWFERVRQTTRSTLARLGELQGTIGLRAELATTAHDDAVALLDHHPDNAECRIIAADAKRELSNVALERDEVSQAKSLRIDALGLRRAALASKPEDDEQRLRLVIDLVLIGDTCFAVGDFEGQKQWFREALHEAEMCVSRNPTAETRAELAWCFQRCSAAHLHAGELPAAAEAAHRALAICEDLLAAHPTHESALACARQSHLNLRVLLGWQGDLEAAFSHVREALRVSEKLIAVHPEKREHLAGHLHATLDLAMAETNTDKKRMLLESCEQLAGDWYNTDPHHPVAVHYRASVLLQLGYLEVACGDRVAASNRAFEALTVAQHYRQGNALDLGSRCSALESIIQILRDVGDSDGAEAVLGQARSEMARLARRTDAHPARLLQCADFLLKNGCDEDDASLAVQLAEFSVQRAPAPTAAQYRTLALACAKLGECDRADEAVRRFASVSDCEPDDASLRAEVEQLCR